MTPQKLALLGRTVAVTAERRADTQTRYLEKRGATVIEAPVLRTIDGRDDQSLLKTTIELVKNPPDILIVQTGQGFRWWLDGVAAHGFIDDLKKALAQTAIISRGSKATNAIRHAGLNETWQAPNEVLIDVVKHLTSGDVSGTDVSTSPPPRRIAFQMDGTDGSETVDTLRAWGDHVIPVPIYQYDKPANTKPARDLIDQIIAGGVDAVTFTASPAIRMLRSIARDIGKGEELDEAFSQHTTAVVVGPVCGDQARSVGWRQIVEPQRARLIAMLDTAVDHLTAGDPRRDFALIHDLDPNLNDEPAPDSEAAESYDRPILDLASRSDSILLKIIGHS